MDTFAKGLKVAYRMLEDGKIEAFIKERYKSYSSGIGKRIVDGEADFKELEKYALENSVIKNTSGRQEVLETIVNKYIFE